MYVYLYICANMPMYTYNTHIQLFFCPSVHVCFILNNSAILWADVMLTSASYIS